MSAEQGTREQALAKAFVTLADTLVATTTSSRCSTS